MSVTRALDNIRQIDYTVVFARDMERMRHFYGTVLGFPVLNELGPQWIAYRVGSTTLALTGRGLMFDDEPTAKGMLSVQLAFRVPPAAVDACASELVAQGVAIVIPPTDQAWGHRTLFVRDPDGNVIEIYAEI